MLFVVLPEAAGMAAELAEGWELAETWAGLEVPAVKTELNDLDGAIDALALIDAVHEVELGRHLVVVDVEGVRTAVDLEKLLQASEGPKYSDDVSKVLELAL